MKFYKGLYDLYSFIEKYLILRKELDTLLEIYDRILKIIGIEPLTATTEFHTTREERIKDLIILSITLSSNYDELVSTKYIDLIHEGSDSIKGYDYIFKSLYQVLERKYRVFNDRVKENCLPIHTFIDQTRIHDILSNETLSNMNILENIKRHITEFLDKNILSNLQNTHKRISFRVFHDILIKTRDSIMHSIQEDYSVEDTSIMDLSIDLKDIINAFVNSKVNEFSSMNTCRRQASLLMSPYEIGELLYSLSEIKTIIKTMYFIVNTNNQKFECRLNVNLSDCDYIISRALISKFISDFLENPQSLLSILIEASREPNDAYNILNKILHEIKSSNNEKKKHRNNVKNEIIEIIKSINYTPSREFKNEVLEEINKGKIMNMLGYNKKDKNRSIATNIVYSIIEPISYTIDYVKDYINRNRESTKYSKKCLNRKNIAEIILKDISLFLFMAYANIKGIPIIGSFDNIKAYTLKCMPIQNNNSKKSLEKKNINKEKHLTIDAIMSFDNTLFLVEETIGENYRKKIKQIIENYKKILPKEEKRKDENRDNQSTMSTAPNITIIPMLVSTDNTINQIIEKFNEIKEIIQRLLTNDNMTLIVTNQLLTKHIKIIIDFGNIRLEQDKRDKILTPLETIREIIEYNPSREYPLPYGAPLLLCSNGLFSM